jgi:Fe-S oxidoreductase
MMNNTPTLTLPLSKIPLVYSGGGGGRGGGENVNSLMLWVVKGHGMYDKEKCELCGNCLVACQNTDYDRDTAIEEMNALREGRSADILRQCVTCMACNEICKRGANPFDLISDMQEKMNAFEVPEALLLRYDPIEKMPSEIRKGKPGKPAISSCVIAPRLPRPIEGSIFDDLTHISGGKYQCLAAWLHLGMRSRVKRGIHSFIENLSATGEDEIVFLHTGCYTTVSTLAKEYEVDVPFRYIHLFEYLLEHMKTRQSEIKKLNMKIAYHRPCTSRLAPDKEKLFDDLFELIGVERVSRKYDYKKTLCCGAPLAFRDRNRMRELIENNLEDAKRSHAEAMVFYCVGCFDFLSADAIEQKMDVYMVSDLCRLSLGEELTGGKL